MQYIVCEISGKQYLIKPGQSVNVDYLGDIKELKIDKTLLMVSDDKVEIGKPYLKNEVNLEVIEGPSTKTRVSVYKAKANYRRVTGTRKQSSQVKLVNLK